MRELRVARAAGRWWRMAVSLGGPARAAALRASYTPATRVMYRALVGRDGAQEGAWTRGWCEGYGSPGTGGGEEHLGLHSTPGAQLGNYFLIRKAHLGHHPLITVKPEVFLTPPRARATVPLTWAIAEQPRPLERWEDALQQCVAAVAAIAAAAAETRRRLRRSGNMALQTRGDSHAGAGDAQDRPGGSAFAQWRLLSMARRWRLRAAMRYRRWQEVEPEATYCTDVCWEDVEAHRLAAIALGAAYHDTWLIRAPFYRST